MNNAQTFSLPLTSYLAIVACLGLSLECLIKRYRSWAIPALIIYATTTIWYFVELFYTPENYQSFEPEIVSIAYVQVLIFLITFRLVLPTFTRWLRPKSLNPFQPVVTLRADKMLQTIAVLWVCLLAIGLSRMNWDIMQALFPLTGRAGVLLWGRAAASSAGSTGFLVSSAGYIYSSICAFFGILLFFQRNAGWRTLNVTLILISWPFFLLSGTRNAFLAVVMPGYFTYCLMSRQKLWLKVMVSIGILLFVNFAFVVIINFRNVGFNDVFSQLLNAGEIGDLDLNQQHQGLNMAQELFYINQFWSQGVLKLQYGFDYLVESLNFVPRAIWPSKPLLGQQYNILRGLGGSDSDIGVFATISAGFIGRGIINFGPWVGPVVPGLLMAIWGAILSRLWMQRESILRLSLFFLGLGLTFNLGRDITMLVLWPMVFAYVFVLFLEKRMKRRSIYPVPIIYSAHLPRDRNLY